MWMTKHFVFHSQRIINDILFTYGYISVISYLPLGRSLISKFFNSLCFQPSSSYSHMSHVTHHRSCLFLAFPLVSFLSFSLLAPISSDHLPLHHVQSSSSFCPISCLLSFSFRSWS